MLITSFQSNCVPGVSSVSEDIDNFRRNRSRGCGFVQNCLKSLIIKDKHLWSRMWKPSTFMRENLKFIHRWLKVIHKSFRNDQLSTARPHGFHFLLWIDLLFQYLYGISQRVILCHVAGYLLSAMYDGGMVPSSQVASDGLERSGRHIPAQVHDDLSWVYDFLITFLG